MPTRPTQQDHHPSGTAALQVTGPAQAQLPIPEDIEISIVQVGAIDRYLDPRNPDSPWSATVFRFRPVAAKREDGVLSIEIDHGVTYHLRPNQPYKLVIRQVEGLEIEERFTGPSAMRRPAPKPVGWVPPPPPSGPLAALVAAPAPAPTPTPTPTPVIDPVMPLPPIINDDPRLDRDDDKDERPIIDPPEPGPGTKPKSRLWLVLLLALLLAGGALGYYLSTKDKAPIEAKPSGGTQLETLEAVRDFLSRDPEVAKALAEANTLSAAGKLLDGQLLLYKYAGERGDREAARRMGGFYDPETWAADKSPLPAPNPLEAGRWYKQAAEAGDAEAQYRYGMLLKRGGTDAADGPEQAVVWLRKAAEQGHAEAKKALGA